MTIYGLNIETMPNVAMAADLPEPEVKMGNLKDPAKKSDKITAAKAALISATALDPIFGMVCSVSICRRREPGEGPEGLIARTAFSIDNGESALLEWVWTTLRKDSVRVVTFNGCAFDLPFLYTRSLVRGVQSVPLELNPYRATEPANHVDMMAALHRIHPDALSISRGLQLYAKHLLGDVFPFPDLDQSRLDALLANGEEGRQTITKLGEWNATRALLLYERYYRLLS